MNAQGNAGTVAGGVLVLAGVGAVMSFVVVLAVVVALLGGVAHEEGCGDATGSDGEPVGASTGSLGGVAGTGITRGELRIVRSSRLAGDRFTSGTFVSTAYGPPWGVDPKSGVDQGAGISTSGGLRLNGGAPRKYFIATDPHVIALGQWVWIWPNPFDWHGPFLAADTGGGVNGRHVDFYDWRGRAFQNRWSAQVRVTDSGQDLPAGDAATVEVASVDGARERNGSSSVNPSPAETAARDVTGQPVGFALVDAHGRVVAAVSPNDTNRSASITKAMILVALTQQARARALSATEKRAAGAMIRQSDNAAANGLFAAVGADRVNDVARRAGMTHFELVQRKQTAGGFILGYSRVSAVDQARLFARIDDLLSARHRGFAAQLLESIEGAGRFGIYDAGLDARIRSKGGWRPESEGGWTVNQAAQVTIGSETYGFAVVLGKQATFAAGGRAIAAIARAAFSDAPAAAGACGPVELSGDTGERIGQIARRYLGKDARRQPFADFTPPRASYQWCAWFATNVWKLAGVPIKANAFSGYPYLWGKTRRTLFKAVGHKPRGPTPPVGSALMYGSGPESPGTSVHVNLIDKVNPDGTFMITSGNSDTSRVTREGPCRLKVADPARLTGRGCDGRPVYGIASPVPPT